MSYTRDHLIKDLHERFPSHSEEDLVVFWKTVANVLRHQLLFTSSPTDHGTQVVFKDFFSFVRMGGTGPSALPAFAFIINGNCLDAYGVREGRQRGLRVPAVVRLAEFNVREVSRRVSRSLASTKRLLVSILDIISEAASQTKGGGGGGLALGGSSQRRAASAVATRTEQQRRVANAQAFSQFQPTKADAASAATILAETGMEQPKKKMKEEEQDRAEKEPDPAAAAASSTAAAVTRRGTLEVYVEDVGHFIASNGSLTFNFLPNLATERHQYVLRQQRAASASPGNAHSSPASLRPLTSSSSLLSASAARERPPLAPSQQQQTGATTTSRDEGEAAQFSIFADGGTDDWHQRFQNPELKKLQPDMLKQQQPPLQQRPSSSCSSNALRQDDSCPRQRPTTSSSGGSFVGGGFVSKADRFYSAKVRRFHVEEELSRTEAELRRRLGVVVPSSMGNIGEAVSSNRVSPSPARSHHFPSATLAAAGLVPAASVSPARPLSTASNRSSTAIGAAASVLGTTRGGGAASSASSHGFGSHSTFRQPPQLGVDVAMEAAFQRSIDARQRALDEDAGVQAHMEQQRRVHAALQDKQRLEKRLSQQTMQQSLREHMFASEERKRATRDSTRRAPAFTSAATVFAAEGMSDAQVADRKRAKQQAQRRDLEAQVAAKRERQRKQRAVELAEEREVLETDRQLRVGQYVLERERAKESRELLNSAWGAQCRLSTMSSASMR